MSSVKHEWPIIQQSIIMKDNGTVLLYWYMVDKYAHLSTDILNVNVKIKENIKICLYLPGLCGDYQACFILNTVDCMKQDYLGVCYTPRYT